jgi:hypothetical protein
LGGIHGSPPNGREHLSSGLFNARSAITMGIASSLRSSQ